MKSSPLLVMICWEDCVTLFQKHRKILKKITIVGSLFCFFYLLLQPLCFLSQGTIKYVGKGDASSKISGVLKQMGALDPESNPIAILRSEILLKKVVEKCGLQIQTNHFFDRLKERGRIHFSRELLGDPTPFEEFVFQDVHYSGYKNCSFSLIFRDADCFDCLEKGKVVLSGKTGTAISLGDVKWTLKKAPKNFPLGKPISFRVIPWFKSVLQLLKRLEIQPSPLDPTVFQIRYRASHPRASSDLVNSLVKNFIQFLEEKKTDELQKQRMFLEERKTEIARRLTKLFDENQHLFKNNLQTERWGELIDNSQRGGLLQEEKYRDRLNALEKQLIVLENISLEPPPSQKSCFLKDNREKKLTGHALFSLPHFQQWARLFRPELSSDLFFSPPAIQQCIDQFENFQKEETDLEKKALFSELQGMDLEGINSLYADHLQFLRESQMALAQLQSIALDRGANFPPNSLGPLLSDAASQDLIKKIGETQYRLEQKKDYSAREKEWMTKELVLYKSTLKKAVDQAIQWRKTQLHLLHQKLQNLLCFKKKRLLEEKKRLENSLRQMESFRETLPEKWKKQRFLKVQSELHGGVLKELAKLEETHLAQFCLSQGPFQILDSARPAPFCQRAHWSWLSLLGGLLFSTLFFGWKLLWGVGRGFPLSQKALSLHGQSILSSKNSPSEIFLKLAASLLQRSTAPTWILTFLSLEPLTSHLFPLLRGKKVLLIHKEKADSDFLVSLKKEKEWDRAIIDTSAPIFALSPQWLPFKETIQKDYDLIFLFSQAAYSSAEAQTLFSLSDCCFLPIREEKLEEVAPFFEGNKTHFLFLKNTFIYSSIDSS